MDDEHVHGEHETADGRLSPAPSLYSFHPSVDERFIIRQLHGRLLNSQNETYMLPADQEEHERLDIQHEMYKHALGGLFPARELVERALQPRADGSRPAICDIGTGSGSWALDMANEYPHCDVTGVDLVLPKTQREMPPNCRFEIDDANLGFPHFENSFNLVHIRAVSAGIRDWEGLLDEMVRALRPGGVLVLADGDLRLYDEHYHQMPALEPGQPGFSWTQRIFFTAWNAMKARGGNLDVCDLNPQYLDAISGLTDRGWTKVWIPIGPWPKGLTPEQKMLSELLLKNTTRHIMGMTPLLVDFGYTPDLLAQIQQLAVAELREGRARLYTRWHFAWAVKGVV